jgi:cell division protein FtsN
LTLGLTVALGVYLVDHGYVDPGQLFGDGPVATGPVPKASSQVARPRFDFYTILPEMEVVVPEQPVTPTGGIPTPTPNPAPRPEIRAQTAAAGGYILQAGSFRSSGDADALKAQLALLGYQASVQTVTINRDTYHRVRLGPYADLEAANAARARLGNNAVSTLLLRLKG